jgi:hemerythrin
MPLIDWTDDLAVGQDFMDEDHQAFVALVNRIAEAEEAAVPALFAALRHHAEAHFAREEDLMRRTGFFAFDCHKGEHTRVLAEMRHFQGHLDNGRGALVRAYVTETLPGWFILHRNTMDSATAAFAAQHAA